MKRKKPPRLLTALAVVYGLILLTLSVSNALGPERWWLGSLNLYLPQWLWAIPGGLLLMLYLGFARRWLWVPLLATLWALGPIMGFCWHGLLRSAAPPANAAEPVTRLRIMTYNVKWTMRDQEAIVRDIRAFHPDLIQLQDSGGVLQTAIGQELSDWNVRVSEQYIVASRKPLPPLQASDVSYADSRYHCFRYTLPLGSETAAFYDVHLLSPRMGLVSVRHRQIEGMRGNADERLREATVLAGILKQEPGPTVVTGDLNAPVQSLVCRRLFEAGLRDAFSEAGIGYGYTYGRYTKIGRPYVRIDHILASRHWQIERCWVGNSQGSDHCPVIADLVLTSAP